VCVCVCAELYGDDERRVGCHTLADFSITKLRTSETGDSFDIRHAEQLATAKAVIEISGSATLVSTTG
jgi:hypothetical protein